jgi:hypothetical protein
MEDDVVGLKASDLSLVFGVDICQNGVFALRKIIVS